MNNKSFTLIELLVVIVIIGILAGVIMISTSSSIDKANISKLKIYDDSIKNSLLMNLVSEWTFEDGLNIGKDFWGSNDGTLTNGPVWKNNDECISKGCLSFDGVDDYVVIPSGKVDLNNTSFTLSLWANIERYGDPTSPCYDYRSNLFYSVTPSGLGFFIETTSGGLRVYYSGNSCGECHVCSRKYGWNLITITYNKMLNILKVYQNNEQCGGDIIISSPLTGLNTPTYIGGGNNAWCGNAYTKAIMDDIKIYNEAITSSQIKQNYIAGLDSLLSSGSISREEYNNRVSELAEK